MMPGQVGDVSGARWLRVAEQEMAESGEGTERRRAAARDKKRWELFLSLAG
jgi:hypothetical protein